MSFKFGAVVSVPFQFTNQTASKKRPAVVVSNSAYNAARPDVVIMAITTKFRPNGFGEIWIDQWQAAGLLISDPPWPSRSKPRSYRRSFSANSAR
jgi:mRNA interferase MazF